MKTIDFMRFRNFAFIFSLSLIVILIAGTAARGGFNFGIDFAGGIKIIATFDKGVDEGAIRESIKNWNPSVQRIGEEEQNEYIITAGLPETDEAVKAQLEDIKKTLESSFQDVKFLSVENVGPTIGSYLKRSAVKLLFISVILMMIYLAYRFELKYAVGVFMALIHDVTLCVVFSGAMGVEINVPVLAAILTIFGFSANDTIVIFDRIRENLQVKSRQTFTDIINKSITQTLSRTFITTLTVLYSAIILFWLGGDVLREFSLVMLVGLIAGTYSTIFIASPAMVLWEKYTAK